MNFKIRITIISALFISALFFSKGAFAATEFVSIIDPDSGTGTDYVSLNAWENAVDSDLTASNNKVFSHGGKTGAIADGASVTGATSGATGTVYHTTSTQIYLNVTSGTFQAEQVQVDGSNYVTTTNTGDSAIAVASCRSSSGTADSTAVTVGSWTTSATNYIKIWTDASAGNRHSGEWDDSKYSLEVTTYQALILQVGYVKIDGLQIKTTYETTNYNRAGIITTAITSGDVYISDNLITASLGSGLYGAGIVNRASASVNTYIYNNIIYDWTQSSSGIYSDYNTAYIYNNTIYNSDYGININGGNGILKNNISYGSVVADYSGTISSSSTNNLSEDDTAPNYGTYYDNAIVGFIDVTNKNFHLSSVYTSARDKGADLSADANLAFSTDIDGDTRPINSTWDIGADEAQTAIFRSVGPSATSALDNDNSQQDTLTITSGVGIFEVAVADNVGVGDAVVYDSDSDNDLDASDSVAFIKYRTDSAHYILQTQTGAIPADLAVNDKWAIYRAYTSLANAESGTKNTSIPITFTGGNRDLVANNEQWNIACYANGTTSDSTTTHVSDWTTNEENYIKIYTPYASSEVGISQRHSGVWNSGKYNIVVASDAGIRLSDDFVYIEGLQINISAATSTDDSAIWINAPAAGWKIYVSECILRGAGSASYWHVGVESYATTVGTAYVSNCVAYDFKSSVAGAGYMIDAGGAGGEGSTMYVYNSMAYNSDYGYRRYDTGINLYIKNSITQNCTNGFAGTYDAGSDYNISDLTNDAPSPSYRTNLATDVSFVDETNDDFHLAQSDTLAKDAGIDLEADSYLPFSDDIDGASRDASINTWDIGADETATPIYRSVGPSATSALDNDNSHADTLTIGSGTATFEVAVADNIGVGDVLVVDTGGTDQAIDSADTLLFIHGRTDSTHYTLKDQYGATPSTSTTNNDTWHIYRAYTSLYNAEAGTINSTLSTLGFSFNGGNRDLITNNEQWNVAAYANGTTADTASVSINGWTTGAQNYINIYTPVSSTEVGINQRHNGKWDDAKYRIERDGPIMTLLSKNIRIEGLQIYLTGSNLDDPIHTNGASNGTYYIDSVIIKGLSNSSNMIGGIAVHSSTNVVMYVSNSIIYNITSSASARAGLYLNGSTNTMYAYNNTIYGCSYGIQRDGSGTAVAKNNAVFNNADDFSGTFSTLEYNACDDADCDSGTGNVGLDDTESDWDTIFENNNNGDLHLLHGDTQLRDAGVDLSADANLAFNDDIDGHTRGNNSAWDIGADEGSLGIYYSVGQDGTTDRKTGTPTMTISSGTATFSAAQTGNIGVGDVIDYDTDNKKLYIKSKTDTSNWKVVSVTGETPADVGTGLTVNSIKRVYSSLSSAEAGASALLGTSDLKTGNYALNFPCYYDTGADTAGTTIDGYTTGVPNYIKIYTPNNTSTESNTNQRHGGKWDGGKYRLETSNTNSLRISDMHVRVDGLQINFSASNSNYQNGILVDQEFTADIRISNNIINGNMSGTSDHSYGIRLGWVSTTNSRYGYIWNNIITNWRNGSYADQGAMGIHSGWTKVYVSNNTLYDSYYGFNGGGDGEGMLKNNIVQNCDDGYDPHSGSFDASSDYNISDLAADAPGSNSKNSTTVNFVSTDSGVEDLHLSASDMAARDAGTDLSADSGFAFSTDIDGETRPINSTWDIGADEAQTAIFRSVGPSATSALDNDNSQADTLTITSGVGIFEVAVENNVGVGDAVVYDSDSDNDLDASDSIAFIRLRTDSTHYILQTQSGAAPADLAVNDKWAIYRAYASLANAESGTKNTSIPIAFTGGNRDLVTNNEQWNIACYANGTTADATAVTVQDWTTGAQNYIKIYTPVSASEVGASQRHSGKWDTSKYYIETSNNSVLRIDQNHAWVDGLQIRLTAVGSSNQKTLWFVGKSSDDAYFRASSNIVRGITDSAYNYHGGIHIYGNGTVFPSGSARIWNNIVYDFNQSTGSYASGIEVYESNMTSYIYNNTVSDTYWAIYQYAGTAIAKNNITQNSTDGFHGTFDASSDYNISDLASDAPGSNSKNSTTVPFLDSANNDFHLVTTNNPAMNAGVDLSSDVNLHFSTDIDRESRPVGASWDIGADEYSASTKAKLKGDIKFQGDVKIK